MVWLETGQSYICLHTCLPTCLSTHMSVSVLSAQTCAMRHIKEGDIEQDRENLFTRGFLHVRAFINPGKEGAQWAGTPPIHWARAIFRRALNYWTGGVCVSQRRAAGLASSDPTGATMPIWALIGPVVMWYACACGYACACMDGRGCGVHMWVCMSMCGCTCTWACMHACMCAWARMFRLTGASATPACACACVWVHMHMRRHHR